MKTIVTLSVATLLFFTACTKTNDVPSLHEQMIGKWKLESYTTEQYNSSTGSLNRQTTTGAAGDYVEFLPYDRILVDFNPSTVAVWDYNIIDRQTLDIEGKDWSITNLNYRQFQLSLNTRDSSGTTQIVELRLKRP